MSVDDRAVVWFDIDNTLYSASSRISHAMGERIHAYFVRLGLSHEEASELHLRYYTQYGLALRGLTRHHDIGNVTFDSQLSSYPHTLLDPLEFDRQCDGSLPLEDMITFDPNTCKLFEDLDRSKVRVWGLTNAYRPHAERVLRILNLTDLIDGLVYCDYQVKDFSCKPEPEFYKMAMKQAGISDPSKCYFVDDNRGNIDGARAQNWAKCAHFCEKGLEAMEGGRTKQISNERAAGAEGTDGVDIVTTLDELRDITRLQNSLQHLKQTQTVLQEYVDAESPEDVDPEITKALEENTTVMYAPCICDWTPVDWTSKIAVVLKKNGF
ncbi:hypothetical protein C0991_003959 [Blastosporella zonata]|nr:hypothetical protein C0991_003959 [Blastosporella zonata]